MAEDPLVEDPKVAARRIVEEVLAARAAAAPEPTSADAVDAEVADEVIVRVDGPPTPPDDLDPRAGSTLAAGLADDLDDRPSRVVARRIVEEVLAAHAAAEREVEVPDAAIEATTDLPAAATVPLRPVPERDAVTTGPDLPTVVEDEEPDPTDAAAIARRIVASVLAEAATAPTVDEDADTETAAGDTALDPDSGPPPLPLDVRDASEPEPSTEPEPELAAEPEPEPAAEPEPEPAAEPEPEPELAVEREPGAEATIALPVASDEAVEADETDETVALPVVAQPDGHTAAAGALDDLDDAGDLDDADHLDEDAEGTLALPAHGHVDPAEQEGGVATLSRSAATTEADTTIAVPTAAGAPRRNRWVLATILGAVGLAVLLPLAIGAVRDLVALS